MVSNSCAICEVETTLMNRRKIANDEFVCMDCFKKAGSLTTKQMLKLKTVTAAEIRESIIKSGHNIKKYSPPTLEELEDIINPKVKCPSCKSIDIQFMQNNKKAFSVGKAVGGAVLTGGIGTLAGFAGKKGEDQWRCNNCGNIFATKRQK